jgi:hypothetical protein
MGSCLAPPTLTLPRKGEGNAVGHTT